MNSEKFAAWIEQCERAREWFKFGMENNAFFVIFIFDMIDKDVHPIFVFDHDGLKAEIKLMPKTRTFLGALSTTSPIDMVDDIFRPYYVTVSRVIN